MWLTFVCNTSKCFEVLDGFNLLSNLLLPILDVKTAAKTTVANTDMITGIPISMKNTVTIHETMTTTSSVQIPTTIEGQSMSSYTQSM